ncbi:transcobalamin-1-like [Hemicordylus capensis]|uniref:transcobalamin-1-like n=1 Tax=Hemicordylus capensis TaxID=884348 RepID=UPI00230455BE|nr:transcobalamin-1-like [Hemicordylus capensis]XP_053098647.1 transcobalamin-1-like [Hemicordylus capensis]
MMRSLVGLAFLLLLKGQCCLGCAVSEEQRPLVTYLLRKMIQSTSVPGALPNPSVLLALRLAWDHNLSTEQRLLKILSQDAVDRVQNRKPFSSGQVALYALAHQASCSDPRRVSAKGSVLDLVQLLGKKFEMELENIKIHGNPLTNYYQLGLCVLALCQLQGSLSPSQAADLFIPDEKKYNLAGQFSVDTAAVAVLAQICIQTTENAILPGVNKTITANVQWLLKNILEQKSSDGVIGNMYSTGEAMQALTVSNNYLTPGSWSCPLTLATVLAEIPKGTFDNPMAAAQIVPSLEGRTYLDVKTINCSKDRGNLTLITPPTIPSTSHHQSSQLITVTYTVTDSVNNTFTDSTRVSVPKGSVFLNVMEAAQAKDPKRFRFTYEQSSWGPYITSVRGLTADNNKRTYWQLLSGKTPLSKGAGEYVVSNGEKLVIKYTVY